MVATTAPATASRSARGSRPDAGAASASTTSRSVPLAGSVLPNTATQPRRMPATPPTASSISSG